MALQEKIDNLKQIIKLVCEVIPQILNIIREVVATIHDIKTV